MVDTPAKIDTECSVPLHPVSAKSSPPSSKATSRPVSRSAPAPSPNLPSPTQFHRPRCAMKWLTSLKLASSTSRTPPPAASHPPKLSASTSPKFKRARQLRRPLCTRVSTPVLPELQGLPLCLNAPRTSSLHFRAVLALPSAHLHLPICSSTFISRVSPPIAFSLSSSPAALA